MHHPRQSPCYKCKERTIDPPCHDRCTEYLNYQNDMVKIREKRRVISENDGIHIELVEKNLRRYRGGKGPKWNTK